MFVCLCVCVCKDNVTDLAYLLPCCRRDQGSPDPRSTGSDLVRPPPLLQRPHHRGDAHVCTHQEGGRHLHILPYTPNLPSSSSSLQEYLSRHCGHCQCVAYGSGSMLPKEQRRRGCIVVYNNVPTTIVLNVS